MLTDQKKFNYQRPKMTYDKASGNVTIIDPADEVVANRVIDNVDEVFQMKQQLYEELGLDDKGFPINQDELKEDNIPELAEKLKKARTAHRGEYDYDPSQYYAFSRDLMRIDVGLMIQRPPIFLHMRQNAIDFIKQRTDHMREYHCDPRQYIEELNEVSKLNEDCLSQNPYASRMNIDNYPSHAIRDPESGEDLETYAAASK